MSRTDGTTEASGKNSNEGTSARTRPFSFEEIMLRRKEKLAANSNVKASEMRKLSAKVDVKGSSNQPESDEGGYSRSKVSKDIGKRSSKKMEEISKKDDYHLYGNNKRNRASEDTKIAKSHRSKSGREKEIKNDKHTYHRSTIRDQFEYDSEEQEKKHPKDGREKDKHEKDSKSRKEVKRKHTSRIDERSRSEIDSSYLKKHDSGKVRYTEYSERNYRKKEIFQLYNEEPRSKRRRSRSQEYDRDRDNSVSLSPRAHKHSYYERGHEESSFQFFKDKSRKMYSDADKYGTSGDGGYTSGHLNKHGSGLGGYSPRKRRTEAAIKTPSPTARSPEKKSATWDQPPAGKSHTSSASIVANFQPVSKMHELASSTSVTLGAAKIEPEPSLDNASIVMNATDDSFQLTQATRPMRRLYVENLPPSASDKTVINCFNDFLQSSAVNHIQENKPCISCIMNKEKCQALVEFLTPEDATRALSFDGRSFSGSVIKIRRPRDFVEAATGDSEKPEAVTRAISDVVKDSPNKIFIGGIPEVLSSDMLMEIVSSFGPLTSYHFEFHEGLNKSCAFLEYVDHSVTLKVCAGLSGIELGGHVLTAVQALSGVHEEAENAESAPSYSIPMHAMPLLENPTKVLKLKNVFNRDEFLLLSEAELEETLEDIRLECSRFGTIKSLNIVKSNSICVPANEAYEHDPAGNSSEMEALVENFSIDSKQNGDAAHLDNIEALRIVIEIAKDPSMQIEGPTIDLEKKVSADSFVVDDATVCEEHLQLGDPSDDLPSDPILDVDGKTDECLGGEIGLASEMEKLEVNTKLAENDEVNITGADKPEDNDGSIELMAVETSLNVAASDEQGVSRADGNHVTNDLDIFELGCIFVEFSRQESACTAAHCLHGRVYSERIVTVGYVQHDLYLAQFQRLIDHVRKM